MTFGDRITEFVKKTYKTKKRFAGVTGMTQQQLNSYVQEDRKPGFEVLEKFLNAGMSIDWLITGNGPPEYKKSIKLKPEKNDKLSKDELMLSYSNVGDLLSSKNVKLPLLKDYVSLKNLMKDALTEALEDKKKRGKKR